MRPAMTRRTSRTDRRLGPSSSSSSSSAVSLEADEGFSVDDLGESC